MRYDGASVSTLKCTVVAEIDAELGREALDRRITGAAHVPRGRRAPRQAVLRDDRVGRRRARIGGAGGPAEDGKRQQRAGECHRGHGPDPLPRSGAIESHESPSVARVRSLERHSKVGSPQLGHIRSSTGVPGIPRPGRSRPPRAVSAGHAVWDDVEQARRSARAEQVRLHHRRNLPVSVYGTSWANVRSPWTAASLRRPARRRWRRRRPRDRRAPDGRRLRRAAARRPRGGSRSRAAARPTAGRRGC